MAKLFGTLFIRIKTHNFKTNVYVNTRTRREFKVTTLCQMQFA